MRQLWRIQSIAVTEPWASYSSVAAKVGGAGRKAELEQIDAVAKPHQMVPKLGRGQLQRRHPDESLDRLDERLEWG